MVLQNEIEKAVEILRRAGQPKKIILFGSYARGDMNSESDVDFLVVQEAAHDRAAEMVKLRRHLSPLRIPVDIVVVSVADYQKWSTTPGNLFYEVATEGKALYEAA